MMTKVGSGIYTYELVSDWAKLPAGQTFAMVSAVATDSQNRVYVFQRKDPPIVIFDTDGSFLGSWGDGNFVSPHGFYIGNDEVYLTDRDSSVAIKYTLDGKPLLTLGQHGVHSDTGCELPQELVPRSAGPFNYPTEMVVAPSGDIYVSDGYRNARVHRFSGDGTFISSWGEPGKVAPNEFHLPHSMIVGRDERVYVCDRENSRIQIFSAEGEFITMWTDMLKPFDISQDSDGAFYVNESDGSGRGLPPQVSVFDSDGNILARWEDSASAHGSWVDANGDIYMARGAAETLDKYVRV